jgi:hypothetical protein
MFATHPVHVEAVANVVSRAELLSALCVLASFLCYRMRGSCVGFVGACALFCVAVLCKETALTVVGLFVVEEALAWREFRGVWKGAVVRLGCVGLVCGAYLRFKASLTGDHFMPRVAAIDNSAVNAPTPLGVTLSVLQLHSVYLYRLVMPMKLSCDSSPNVLPNILDLSGLL